MLIQITNRCHLGCRHCLHDSKPDGGMMSMETLEQVKDFIRRMGTTVIVLTGGEPTEHPKFKEIVESLRTLAPFVVITSNGEFLRDEQKTEVMKELLQDKFTILQVTSLKEYYSNYDFIKEHTEDLKNLFEDSEERLHICQDTTIYVKQLGRAATDKMCQEKAMSQPYSTSCIVAASMTWDRPFRDAILENELLYQCKPLVDWQGNIHLSESWLCPSIGHVKDFDVNTKVKFKPCGKCADYKKFLDSKDFSYTQVKKQMGIET